VEYRKYDLLSCIYIYCQDNFGPVQKMQKGCSSFRYGKAAFIFLSQYQGIKLMSPWSQNFFQILRRFQRPVDKRRLGGNPDAEPCDFIQTFLGSAGRRELSSACDLPADNLLRLSPVRLRPD